MNLILVRYFIPQKSKSGKQRSTNHTAENAEGAVTRGSRPNTTKRALHRPLTSTWKALVQRCLPLPCPPWARVRSRVPSGLPMCSESPDINWVSRGHVNVRFPPDSSHMRALPWRSRVRTLLSHFCESSDKDLMIVTGRLQRWAYKMVTSPTSLFDNPNQPDVLLRSLSNCCKVWRPESCIFHPAYCVPSSDMRSRFTFTSDYQKALIRQEPALSQNE